MTTTQRRAELFLDALKNVECIVVNVDEPFDVITGTYYIDFSFTGDEKWTVEINRHATYVCYQIVPHDPDNPTFTFPDVDSTCLWIRSLRNYKANHDRCSEQS